MRRAAMTELTDVNVSGEAIDRVSDNLLKALDDEGVTYQLDMNKDPEARVAPRLIRVNGKNYDARKYSEMVVRTESRAAHSQGTIQRLVDNQHDVVQVTSHMTDCETCGAYDGQKYSITGRTAGLEALPDTPPFHPNCRHLLTAALA